jgi:hypothetical protein
MVIPRGKTNNVAKYLAKEKNQHSQQCRICDTPWNEFDDPSAKGRPIRGSVVAKYVGIVNDGSTLYDARNQARYYLETANYRAIRLGWTDMLFCDNKLGINGAIPPDILHMLRHGLMKYLLASFFGMKRLLKKARTVKNNDSTVTEEEEEEEDEDDDQADDMSNVSEVIEEDELDDDVKALGDEFLSKYGIFTENVNQRIDVYTQRLGRHLQRQSCKDFSRAYFSCGISSNTKKDEYEEVLVILLVLILLCSDGIGDDLCSLIDRYQNDDSIDRSIAWIKLLVSVLLMDECLHWNWIKLDELEVLRAYMPICLKRFKTVLNRKKGARMKILKFHLFTHVVSVFENFGLFKAVDTERTEAAHKAHKQAGQ